MMIEVSASSFPYPMEAIGQWAIADRVRKSIAYAVAALVSKVKLSYVYLHHTTCRHFTLVDGTSSLHSTFLATGQ